MEQRARSFDPARLSSEFALPRECVAVPGGVVFVTRFPDGVVDPGRTVICLPGYSETGASFSRLRDLARRFDLRMLTLSRTDRDAGYDLAGALAHRTSAYASRFDHPVLVGDSFGGLVAIRAAASLGDRVAGLVLISTFLRAGSLRHAGTATRLLPLHSLLRPFAAVAARITGGPMMDRAAVLEMCGESLEINPAEKKERLRAALAIDLRAEASAIHVPVMVIHGSRDPLVPVEAARELAGSFAGAEMIVIDGAGHLPHLTHARQVRDALARFFDRVFAAQTSMLVE